MMRDLLNSLPNDNPITSLCIVDDPVKCPEGFQLVSKTFDQGIDADLWKDKFFGRRTTRYLCFSKTVETLQGHIFDCLVLINDKDLPPKDFELIALTRDTEQPAMKKKNLCYRMGLRSSLCEAITDVIVLSKSTKRPPNGFTLAGEINSLSICFKLTAVTPTANQNSKQTTNLPYQLAPGQPQTVQGFPTWSPGYRPNKQNEIHLNRANSSGSYSTAIDGIPFAINPKYDNIKNLMQFNVPHIIVKSNEQIEIEYGYDFRVEHQTAANY